MLRSNRTVRVADEAEAMTDDGIRLTVETAEKNRILDTRIDPPKNEMAGNNSPDGE